MSRLRGDPETARSDANGWMSEETPLPQYAGDTPRQEPTDSQEVVGAVWVRKGWGAQQGSARSQPGQTWTGARSGVEPALLVTMST